MAAPWGVVDFSDISRAQAAFVAPSLLSPADYHTCDVTGGAYCGPTNQILNFADISTVVNAFQGYNYAANCPVPCSSGSGSIRPRNPYFFTGRRLDLDVRPPDPLTGGAAPARSLLTLYDHRARAYDALHGRFLQRDPLGHLDGMNLYEAFKGNPLRWLDPTGLKNWEAYFAARERNGAFYAAFWDWMGAYEITPSGRDDDFDRLVKELENQRLAIKQLGVGLETGLEVVGAFNDGADIAIVVNEIAGGKLSVQQLAVLLPFVGNGHIKLLNKCGKVLHKIDGPVAEFLGSIKPARELRRLTKGIRQANGVEIHHLIEKRFASRLGIADPDDIEGVLVDVLTHRGAGPESITNALRARIPYRAGGDYSEVPYQEIFEAHRQVYERIGIPEVVPIIRERFQKLGIALVE